MPYRTYFFFTPLRYFLFPFVVLLLNDFKDSSITLKQLCVYIQEEVRMTIMNDFLSISSLPINLFHPER
jgi:hypothetical protein